jgi:hypothetical protein
LSVAETARTTAMDESSRSTTLKLDLEPELEVGVPSE